MRQPLIILLSFCTVLGFTPPIIVRNGGALHAKGGRGGLDVSSGTGKARGIGGDDDVAASKKSNWIATSIPSLDNLPKETNTVKVIDTMVPSLIDKNTNPTGAVSVVNYKSDTDTTTYCFSVSCASCKIPLTKGKVLPPKESKDARLECDFCGATYNLRSGVQVEKEGGKLLGFLFNQNKEERLPVYALGEKAGKVYISMP